MIIHLKRFFVSSKSFCTVFNRTKISMNFNNVKMGSSSSTASIVENLIMQSISSRKVVIFSKSYCPYCTKAKEQFRKLNVDFLAIEIETRHDCDEIQDALQLITGARSVPRVFIDGNFVGGGDDVERLYNSGELAKLVGK